MRNPRLEPSVYTRPRRVFQGGKTRLLLVTPNASWSPLHELAAAAAAVVAPAAATPAATTSSKSSSRSHRIATHGDSYKTHTALDLRTVRAISNTPHSPAHPPVRSTVVKHPHTTKRCDTTQPETPSLSTQDTKIAEE